MVDSIGVKPKLYIYIDGLLYENQIGNELVDAHRIPFPFLQGVVFHYCLSTGDYSDVPKQEILAPQDCARRATPLVLDGQGSLIC